MLYAIIAAVLAGLCFGVAGVLQQNVASHRPDDEELSGRLLARLVRRRRWLAGLGIAVAAYLFQALALHFGPLTLVQPLIVMEVIFALPLSVRLRGMRLGRREWLGALAVVGGLAVSIIAARPRGGHPLEATALGWVITLGAAAILAAAVIIVAIRRHGTSRAALLAFGAAIVLGLESALLAAAVALFSKGVLDALTSWQVYLMATASISGLLLVQSAFQAGPLAASMPIVDVIEPTTAIVIGLALFGESVSTGLWNLVGVAVGIPIVIAGIALLDTSPVVHRLQQAERRDRD